MGEEFKRIQQENLNEQEQVKGRNQRDILEAQKKNDVNTQKKKAEQEQAAIENEMRLEAAKTEAEIMRQMAKASAEAIREEAEANKQLLTPEYLELQRFKAIVSNSKLIFGDIPQNVFLSGDMTSYNQSAQAVMNANL